jgi:hypothetical protein
VRVLLAALLGAAALAAPAAQTAPGAQTPATQTPATRTFTGVVTDGECARADHSRMRMGPTDAECAAACVDAHGATYVLYDGRGSYELSDQTIAAKFAAQKVDVAGSLDEKKRTITVASMRAAR